MTHYVVVENAGYEGEYQWPRKFKNSWDARMWMVNKFGDEVETLHFEVAKVLENGDLTYDY